MIREGTDKERDMTAAEIVEELRPLGLESYRKVLRNHGVQGTLFGVKIEEMKKVVKSVKKDYRLALDLYELKGLMESVQSTIHQQPNRVRKAMNSFVIAVGSYVSTLTEAALQAGAKIGPVTVDMGNTACKVPYAPEYIEKVRQRGSIG